MGGGANPVPGSAFPELDSVFLALVQRRAVWALRERADFLIVARVVVLAVAPVSYDSSWSWAWLAAARDELQEVLPAAEARQCGRRGSRCRPGQPGGIAIWYRRSDRHWHPGFSGSRLPQQPIR